MDAAVDAIETAGDADWPDRSSRHMYENFVPMAEGSVHMAKDLVHMAEGSGQWAEVSVHMAKDSVHMAEGLVQ